MENQLDQVPKGSERRGFLITLLVAAGGLVVLCGLIAAGGVYYVVARPYFGPRSQAVLAPDHTLVSTVQQADLVADAEILTARARAMGARVTFQENGHNQIVAEGPPSDLTRELLDEVSAIGLLELVDVGYKPVAEGTTVATDFGYPYFAAVPGTKQHTVMTNAEFGAVSVQQGQLEGQFVIAFTLTPNGSKTLSDFTASHVGQYLAIVMDKKVLSCPAIKSAITGGQGVIEGGFTQEEAQSLAAYLGVRGPLPVPLEVVNFVDAGK